MKNYNATSIILLHRVRKKTAPAKHVTRECSNTSEVRWDLY